MRYEDIGNYDFGAFSEICETLTNNSGRAVLFHAVADMAWDDQYLDFAWIVEVQQASADSYNLETFEYPATPVCYARTAFDNYEEANAFFLRTLQGNYSDQGI